MSRKVNAYIDGFNLYFGLRDQGWKRYYWLNLRLLVSNLLQADQTLGHIKYFTARISSGDRTTPQRLKAALEEKRRRQSAYLEALSTLKDLTIYEGHYLPKVITCFKCNNSWPHPEEKMTDVNIATELLLDAFNDRFDTALIVSGDSDLVPPVKAVRTVFPSKRIIMAFPPGRVSDRLRREASGFLTVSEAKFRKSMFPDRVLKKDGFVLERPESWNRNISRVVVGKP